MTLSDIEVLIHFHTSGEPHPRSDAPAVIDAISRYIACDMLKEVSPPNAADGYRQPVYFRRYETTERARLWLLMLQATPFPKQCYVDPRDGALLT